jgi:hypothetical protein
VASFILGEVICEILDLDWVNREVAISYLCFKFIIYELELDTKFKD